jgi:y4mF family transcriptional regulator
LDFRAGISQNVPDREHDMTVEELGAIVRRARLAQGLRQDQLAAAAGVGLRFLVELERGKPTVRLVKVLAVLNALGCRLQVTPTTSPSGRDA